MTVSIVLLPLCRRLKARLSSSVHRRAQALPESIQFVTFILLHHRAHIPQSGHRSCDTNAHKAFVCSTFLSITATHLAGRALTPVQE
jgi:hypothetical protein